MIHAQGGKRARRGDIAYGGMVRGRAKERLSAVPVAKMQRRALRRKFRVRTVEGICLVWAVGAHGDGLVEARIPAMQDGLGHERLPFHARDSHVVGNVFDQQKLGGTFGASKHQLVVQIV